MLKSLEIVNDCLYLDSNDYNQSYLSNSELKFIKQDLEILHLILKWKNNFTFCYDIDYLDDEEIEEFKSEIMLVLNYIHHHFGYIPKCFKKESGKN